MTDDEKDRALCEAHCNSAADEYFNPRPQLDSQVNRRIFYAGHRKAWLQQAEATAPLLARIAELERFKDAYDAWQEKTEWVQTTATAGELGKHRADVLRERIEKLKSALSAAPVAQPEPVAWCHLTPSGKIAYFDGKPMVMPGSVGNEHHETPLYAGIKEQP